MTSSEFQVSRRSALVGLGMLLVAVAVLVESRGSATTFFFDEWGWVLHRSHSDLLPALLESHNGHPSVVPSGVFRLLFAVFGIDDYRPFRAAGILVHLFVMVAVVALVWSRKGPVLGLAAGAVVGAMGAGWQNILWPFQIGMNGSVAAGLLVLLLLDRPGPRRSALAAGALLVSLACSSIGISVAFGVAVRLGVARRWREWWVVLGPGACYGIWFLVYGESSLRWGNARLVPGYLLDASSGAVAGLAARPLTVGALGSGVLLVLCARRLVGGESGRAHVLGLLAIPLSFWLLTGLGRAHLGEPTASRYVFVGGVFVAVIAAEVLPRPRTVLAAAAVGLAAAVMVWGGWGILEEEGRIWRWRSDIVRAELLALEWSADSVDPGYRPDLARAPQIVAGPYLDAVAMLGSPAYSLERVRSASEEARQQADRVSFESLRAAPAGVASPAERTCQDLGSNESVEVSPGVVVVAVDSDVDVRVARLANVFPQAIVGKVLVGTAAVVDIPEDRGPSTWRVQIWTPGRALWCPAEG